MQLLFFLRSAADILSFEILVTAFLFSFSAQRSSLLQILSWEYLHITLYHSLYHSVSPHSSQLQIGSEMRTLVRNCNRMRRKELEFLMIYPFRRRRRSSVKYWQCLGEIRQRGSFLAAWTTKKGEECRYNTKTKDETNNLRMLKIVASSL